MPSYQHDTRYLTEALPQLPDYLLSTELYWSLGGDLPRLSLGFLSLALARLGAVRPGEADEFRGQVEAVRAKWRVAWEKKAAREAANRLRLWSAFLADYRASPEQNVDWYPNEARGRAILELLLADLPDAPERAALREVDQALRSRFTPGDFIWEPELRRAFPPESFWFLYGKPKP